MTAEDTKRGVFVQDVECKRCRVAMNLVSCRPVFSKHGTITTVVNSIVTYRCPICGFEYEER
jgi:hypothetical protein